MVPDNPDNPDGSFSQGFSHVIEPLPLIGSTGKTKSLELNELLLYG